MTQRFSFYDLVANGQPTKLRYPVDASGDGPVLLADGRLDERAIHGYDIEDVEVVALGGDRYRLAYALPNWISNCTVQWGDVFHAKAGPDGLEFVALEPGHFVHFVFDGFGSNRPAEAEEQLIHQFDGGWEGMLGVVSCAIPAEHVEAFEQGIRALDRCHLTRLA